MKKIPLLFLFFICLTLTACFPAILVGAGTATGAALGRDSRTLQTMSDDVDIQFQINQKLNANTLTAQGDNINVASFNYIVLLAGQVPSAAVKAKAEEIAQAVPKVRRVYNLLNIAPVEGIIQLGDDSRISANIKTRMTFTSGLNSNNFKIIVENSVVYLMGYADKNQTESALNVIRNSSGVKRVINLVENLDEEPGNVRNTTATTHNSSDSSPVSNKESVTTGSVPEPLSLQPVTSGN